MDYFYENHEQLKNETKLWCFVWMMVWVWENEFDMKVCESCLD